MANLNLAYGRQGLAEMPTLPVNGAKEGLHYDDCPNCGERDIEPFFKNGAEGGGKDNLPGFFDFSIYSHQRQQGGCGLSWSRAANGAVSKMQARGVNPKWVEGSGGSRATSIPSDLYSQQWERIFGNKENVNAT